MLNDTERMLRGRWLLPAAAFFVVVVGLALGAAAQRTPGGTGIGGGAGLKPTLPTLPPMAPTMTPPTVPTPTLPPAPVPQSPPIAVPAAPAAPAAPVVLPRCQLDPGAESCKAAPTPDGGGGDEECSCARDYCYDDPAGFRVCQKQ